MPRLTRPTLAALLAAALVLVLSRTAAPDVIAQEAPLPVSGFLFPIDAVEGTATPFGENLIVERPVQLLIFANATGYGFGGPIMIPPAIQNAGYISNYETVTRYAGDGKPYMTFRGEQTFNGTLMHDGRPHTVNGRPCSGTFKQVLEATGDLNADLPLDHPMQGAQNLKGTWTIVGTGTGCFVKTRGTGEILWPGGQNPILYTGAISRP